MKRIILFSLGLSLGGFQVNAMQPQRSSAILNKDALSERLHRFHNRYFKTDANLFYSPLQSIALQNWNQLLKDIGDYVNQNAPELMAEYHKLLNVNYNYKLSELTDLFKKMKQENINAILLHNEKSLHAVLSSLNQKTLILPSKRHARELLRELTNVLLAIKKKLKDDFDKSVKEEARQKGIKRQEEQQSKREQEVEKLYQQQQQEQERARQEKIRAAQEKERQRQEQLKKLIGSNVNLK